MNEVTRLDRLRPGNVGDLGFLPIEICNNIYAFLLADFETCETCKTELGAQPTQSEIEEHLALFTRARHSIHIAILMASRDVHCEAYDLMVRKNRFVRVRSYGVPQYLLTAVSLPIVTANEDHVQRFRGYVLEVTMVLRNEQAPNLPVRAHDPFDAMIMAKDLGKLCLALMEGGLFISGFKDRLNLTLNLGLVVTAGREARDFVDLDSFERYFSENTKMGIIQPFCDFLSDAGSAQVCGLESADVADTLRRGREWSGPREVLAHLKAQDVISMQHLAKGEAWLACNTRMKCLYEMDALHRGDHWPRLIQEEGELFISSFAGLYFRLNLDCACFYMPAVGNQIVNRLTENTLLQARTALTTDHWKQGLSWRPTTELHARLHLLTARFLRLRGNFADYSEAAIQLHKALDLTPRGSGFELEGRRLVM
ncbi:hypothetical protein F5883DRAFT_636599 [Diaporthe sp. PMI_573]|nr:hypothetical protein F5883DRAFT_636599 [Diaporthaceae sp. PMI_573]